METNKEHYAKEIIEIALTKRNLVALVDNKPCTCYGTCCEKCELNTKDGCDSNKLKEWGNHEYHEPVSKLTELEIEELTYFSHHGAVELNNSFNVDYTYKRWGIYCIEKGELVFDRFIECDYKSLDPRKIYNIEELLNAQSKRVVIVPKQERNANAETN